VDVSASGSCPVAGLGISIVEPWGSATTVSVKVSLEMCVVTQ